MEYHNSLNSLIQNTQASHEKLIRAVCEELGNPDKAEELCGKLLSTSYSSVKKKKDPNAPKKPKSSYMKFCDVKRSEVMKAHPEAKMGDVSKHLGKMWKELSDEEKAQYK